jgi:Outer membrane protein beta-barrel domain
MSFSSRMSLMRSIPLLAATVLCTSGMASAQFAPSPNGSSPSAAPEATSQDSSFSSSIDGTSDLVPDFAAPAAPLPSNGSAAGGQYGGKYRQHSIFSHLTFEAGGGFNAPSNESSPYITWGGNLSLGAGYRFNRYLSLMTEYQFMDDKLPGALIAEAGSDGGHAHIWSLTLAPVLDLFPHDTNSVYVTGGGGFYRKVTSFTDPEETEYCDYFYCYPGTTNVVVGHFSSNQGGWNIGGGFTHRMGGIYGDGKMKIFAEVRYLDVLTPGVYTEPNGLGTTTVAPDTKLIPVTVGIRW